MQPDGKPLPSFDVPVAGISIDDTMFLTIKGNHSDIDPMTDISSVVQYDDTDRSFTTIRELSHLPNGHFIKNSMRLAPADLAGLPAGGPQVLIFGTGEYRNSDAYLSVIQASSFGDPNGASAMRYYAGPGPRWSDREIDAVPIVSHKTFGDISVVYLPDLPLWVMTYDSRDPRGVLLRTASTPWGPWSAPQVLFSLDDAKASRWIYDPKNPRGLAPDPVTPGVDVTQTGGATYAPYLIERFIRLSGDTLTIQYTLSTWVPYVVVRMQSQLLVQR